jgi:hypothetical protein
MTSRTQLLLDEIDRDGSTRDSIAAMYADGIASQQQRVEADFVDWPTVNAALLRRYRPSGLNYIKARGWTLWGKKHHVV